LTLTVKLHPRQSRIQSVNLQLTQAHNLGETKLSRRKREFNLLSILNMKHLPEYRVIELS